jgi:GAF domain-containing protein
MHDGKIWGTINFSSQQARGPFCEEDIQYVERLAADISAALFQDQTEN